MGLVDVGGGIVDGGLGEGGWGSGTGGRRSDGGVGRECFSVVWIGFWDW